MTKNIFKTFNKNLNSLLPIGFNKVSLKLGKSYFFNKLSFRIQIKGISVFIGPNGTGKSTCIKLLAGLIEPDSGEVIFPRNEINSRIIGYVPQKIILLRRSVKENLSHALSISGYPKNEKFSRIDEIIKFAKLKHLANISATFRTIEFSITGASIHSLFLLSWICNPPLSSNRHNKVIDP